MTVLIGDANSPFQGRGEENFEFPDAEAADRTVMRALEEAGIDASLIPVHLGNLDEIISNLDCDAVLNLCDGTGLAGDGAPGVEVIEALERRGLPYSGARSEFYRIGCDKVEMARRFQAAGIPTPPFQIFNVADDELAPVLRDRYPLIVKPRDSGGSAGIHLASVVIDETSLREQASKVISTFGQALVSEYIVGRELTVGILGSGRRLALFPPLEVRFGPAFPVDRGLRTHGSKWNRSSPRYGDFDLLCPAPLQGDELRRVLRAARGAYRAVHGSGFGRVDLRLDHRGPFVIEVNPNCCLEWSDRSLADCGLFPITAHAVGWSYPQLLHELLRQALLLARSRASELASKNRSTEALAVPARRVRLPRRI